MEFLTTRTSFSRSSTGATPRHEVTLGRCGWWASFRPDFVCGLCFGLGYVVAATRAAAPPDTTAQPADAAQTTPLPLPPLPSPRQLRRALPLPLRAAAAADDSANPRTKILGDESGDCSPVANPADSGSGSFSGAAVVHPACADHAVSPQWMVEIALSLNARTPRCWPGRCAGAATRSASVLIRPTA